MEIMSLHCITYFCYQTRPDTTPNYTTTGDKKQINYNFEQ